MRRKRKIPPAQTKMTPQQCQDVSPVPGEGDRLRVSLHNPPGAEKTNPPLPCSAKSSPDSLEQLQGAWKGSCPPKIRHTRPGRQRAAALTRLSEIPHPNCGIRDHPNDIRSQKIPHLNNVCGFISNQKHQIK